MKAIVRKYVLLAAMVAAAVYCFAMIGLVHADEAPQVSGNMLYTQDFESAGDTIDLESEGYFNGIPAVVNDPDFGKSARYTGNGSMQIRLSKLIAGNTYRISLRMKVENNYEVVDDYVEGEGTYSRLDVNPATGTFAVGNGKRFVYAEYSATERRLIFDVPVVTGTGRNSIIFYFKQGEDNIIVDDISIAYVGNLDMSFDLPDGAFDIAQVSGAVINNADTLSQTSEIAGGKWKITSQASSAGDYYPLVQIGANYFEKGREYVFQTVVESSYNEWFIDVENCGTGKASFVMQGRADGDETQNGITLTKAGNAYSLAIPYPEESSGDMMVKIIAKSPANSGEAYLMIDEMSLMAEPVLQGISLNTENVKTEYFTGDEFDSSGLVVKALYSDYAEESVQISECTFDGFDSTVPGKKTITVHYGEFSAQFTVEVSQPGIEGIEVVVTDENALQFAFGESISLSAIAGGIEVKTVGEGGGNKVEFDPETGYTMRPVDLNPYVSGYYDIEISYAGKSTCVQVFIGNRSESDVRLKWREDFESYPEGSVNLEGMLAGTGDIVSEGENQSLKLSRTGDKAPVLTLQGFESFIPGTVYTFSMRLETTCQEIDFDYLYGGGNYLCFRIGKDLDEAVGVSGNLVDRIRYINWDRENHFFSFSLYFSETGVAAEDRNRIKIFASAGDIWIDDFTVAQGEYLYNEEFDGVSGDGYIGSLPFTVRDWANGSQPKPTGKTVQSGEGTAFQVEYQPDEYLYNVFMYLQRAKAELFIGGRSYDFEMKISQNNLAELYLEYEEWNGNVDVSTSMITINFAKGTVVVSGDGNQFSNASYKDGVLRFTMSSSATPQIRFTSKSLASGLSSVRFEYMRIMEEKVPYSMALDASGVKTVYRAGTDMKLDLSGLSANVRFTDESTVSVKEGFTAEEVDLTTVGTKKVVVHCIVSGVTLTAEYTVTVGKETVRIELNTENVAGKVLEGEIPTTEGLIVTAVFSDGTSSVLSAEDYSASMKNEGTKYVVTITYNDAVSGESLQASYDVTVLVEDKIELNTSQVKTEYAYGEQLSLDGLQVYLVYTNGDRTALTEQEYFIDLGGFDPYKPKTYTITVSYGDMNAVFSIVVAQVQGGGEPEAPDSQGGCSGSVAISSAVIGMAALAVAGTVLLKKKKR